MTSQMGRYLSAWNQVTERLTGALTEYFRYQFLDGAGQGLVRNVLLACWLQLYGDPAAERETFADLSIEPSVHGGFMLFRRLPDGPPQRYAFLPSAAELEVVWQRMREFRWSFPEYGSFKQQLGQLRHQYERLEQARESLRQMLRSAESVVVFPEECPLLGGQPVSVPASGKLADERPTIQTHRLSLGYALSPPVSRVPEGGQAAVRRLHDLAAPAGAALLRYLRPARR